MLLLLQHSGTEDRSYLRMSAVDGVLRHDPAPLGLSPELQGNIEGRGWLL